MRRNYRIDNPTRILTVGVMESAADFVACDMPHANRLTIHILAAIAEHEREMISAPTKSSHAEHILFSS